MSEPGQHHQPGRWEALRHALEALPQHPRSPRSPRTWWFRGKRHLDFALHVRHGWSRRLSRLNPYPKPFRRVTVPTEDGIDLAGWFGPQHADAPSEWGLVVVPGMFATKDDTVHKARAIHVHRHWRIPVLAIDLRAFGESNGIATAGWKEALDVHGAARFLRDQAGVRRVAVVAESMGGAAALNALAHDAATRDGLLSGGVLCWSAFVDARDAATAISHRPARGDPFRSTWGGFRRLLLTKSNGAYDRFDDLLEDVARVYGLAGGVDELYELANPKWKAPLLEQPTLLVHSTNDPVVPVRHARRMERYAEGRDNVQVLFTSWGGHTGFEALDPVWFWEVMRRFFGAVNGVELENLAGK